MFLCKCRPKGVLCHRVTEMRRSVGHCGSNWRSVVSPSIQWRNLY
jgi:hypothetical protein